MDAHHSTTSRNYNAPEKTVKNHTSAAVYDSMLCLLIIIFICMFMFVCVVRDKRLSLAINDGCYKMEYCKIQPQRGLNVCVAGCPLFTTDVTTTSTVVVVFLFARQIHASGPDRDN